MKLRDDTGKSNCNNVNNDCYDWHPNTGAGEFAWKWANCCTDGMVRHALPCPSTTPCTHSPAHSPHAPALRRR